MADIFLSYASADREAAHRLAGRLIELGYSVWWDRTIPPGRRAASTGAPADPSSSPPAPSSSSAERDRRTAESSFGRQSRSTATRPAENASRPTAPVGTSSTTVTESERVADSGAPAAPAPRSTGQGRRINLLLARNGGEIVVAAHELWHMVVDGKEETSAWLDTGEAVFSFKDGRPATFDAFAILVPRTVDYNLRTFELLAGNEGPMGYFESVGTFETENVRVIRNPFQEFRFPPVRARYLKVKAMRSHSGGSASRVHEFALYGTLD